MIDPGHVELTVDAEACVGVGQCELLAPDVFRVSDDGVAEVVPPGTLTLDRAQRVVEACPSGAIGLVPR